MTTSPPREGAPAGTELTEPATTSSDQPDAAPHPRRVSPETALVTGLIAVVAAAELVFLHGPRTRFPLTVDEIGYLTFAFRNAHGWHTAGLSGLYRAVMDQKQFGPLLPLTATPLAVATRSIPTVMSTQIAFFALLGASTWGLARTALQPRPALLATAMTVLCPGVVDFTPTFHFVIPGAALLTLALWALVRSDGFARPGWALLGGVAAGLAVLARTVNLALVAALAVAGLITLVAGPKATRVHRSATATAAAGLAFLTCAWWLVPNRSIALGYLAGGGYGAEGSQWAYGHPGWFGLQRWTWRLGEIIAQGLHVPAAAVVAAIALAAGLTVALASPSGGRTSKPTSTRRFLSSPVGVIAMATGLGYLALSTSLAVGTGFVIPLLPGLMILTVAALTRLGAPALRVAFALALITTVGVHAVLVLGDLDPTARTPCVRVEGLPCLRVLQGDIGMEIYQRQIGLRSGSGPAWDRAAREAVGFSSTWSRSHGFEPIVGMTSRDPVLNTNSLNLAAYEIGSEPPPLAQLDPFHGDTVAAYREHLSDPKFGQPNVLISTPPGPGEFQPPVTQATAVHAARELGFRPVHTMRLPDGRVATFYWLARGASIATASTAPETGT